MAENPSQAKEIADLTARARDLAFSIILFLWGQEIETGEPYAKVSNITISQFHPLPGMIESINIMRIDNPADFNDDYAFWGSIGWFVTPISTLVMAFNWELNRVINRLDELGVPWTFQPDITNTDVVRQIWNEHHDADDQWPEQPADLRRVVANSPGQVNQSTPRGVAQTDRNTDQRPKPRRPRRS